MEDELIKLMPTRHGLFQEDGKPPIMRFGIMEIFRLIAYPVFDDASLTANGAVESQKLCLRFSQENYYHLSNVLRRFLDALDIFQLGMASINQLYNGEDKNDVDQMSVHRRAGMAADSCLYYLGLLLDSLGRLIPFVALQNPQDHSCYQGNRNLRCDSFHKARNLAKTNAKFSDVRAVFLLLDDEKSWWNLGFKPGTGMRQRLTHYPDLIEFQGVGRHGSDTFVATAHLRGAMSANASDVMDFIAVLSDVLNDMCGWLDVLEAKLFDILLRRASDIGHVLVQGVIHGSIVPVTFSNVIRHLPRKKFLYMPMCEGSKALKETIQFHSQPI